MYHLSMRQDSGLCTIQRLRDVDPILAVPPKRNSCHVEQRGLNTARRSYNRQGVCKLKVVESARKLTPSVRHSRIYTHARIPPIPALD